MLELYLLPAIKGPYIPRASRPIDYRARRVIIYGSVDEWTLDCVAGPVHLDPKLPPMPLNGRRTATMTDYHLTAPISNRQWTTFIRQIFLLEFGHFRCSQRPQSKISIQITAAFGTISFDKPISGLAIICLFSIHRCINFH